MNASILSSPIRRIAEEVRVAPSRRAESVLQAESAQRVDAMRPPGSGRRYGTGILRHRLAGRGSEPTLLRLGLNPLPALSAACGEAQFTLAFDGLTDSHTMEIVFDPGWPYRPPRVFVQGLDTNHSTLDGFVCLWRDGELSGEWETVDGLFSRIEDWCRRAKGGWLDDDLPFDAYLNFKPKWAVMATFDFESLLTGIGGWGDLNGVPTNPNLLSIRPGPATLGLVSSEDSGFGVGHLQAPPPRNSARAIATSQEVAAEGLRELSHNAESPEASR